MTVLTFLNIEVRATALEAIHHGAGSSGNTSLLRTQEVAQPDGTFTAVPFVSGNSIRHGLRAAAATHWLTTLDVEQGTLTKAEVDFLYSGGQLTKTGANMSLEMTRQVNTYIPFASLLGYSAGPAIVQGKLRVQNLHLVCAENAFRLPDDVADSVNAGLPAGAFRSEEFGTRHDAKRFNVSRSYLGWLEDDGSDGTQMIYDFQTIKPGATLWGQIDAEGITEEEHGALVAALALQAVARVDGADVWQVGAKGSLGFGKVAVTLAGDVPDRVVVPETYEEYLRANRENCLEVLAQVSK